MLYKPSQQLSLPKNYGMYQTELVKLTTSDGKTILSWYTPPKNGNPIMLYFHGNAGNLSHRSEKLKTFIKNTNGYGQLAVSWRGYGGSEGEPTEQGLYNDARAAIEFLLKKGHSINNIFIYGESLGTGVAIQMATEYDIKAVILEAPYTSVENRAAELYPYVPVRFIIKDRFRTIDKIKSVNAPILIFHGYLDKVMPISHGTKILEAANEPKEARFYENVGHTDFNLDEISKLTYEFVENID
jgi:hypothetical protein